MRRERVRFGETADGLEIEVDARPGLAFRLVALAWLAVWALVEWTLVQRYQLARGADPDPFGFVWLCFWSAGGVMSALGIAAHITRRELLRLDGTYLHHYRHFGWFQRSSHFERDRIEDLGPVPEPQYDPLGHDPATFWGFTRCGVAFRYGDSTVRIAARLDHASSASVAGRIEAWLERPGDSGRP